MNISTDCQKITISNDNNELKKTIDLMHQCLENSKTCFPPQIAIENTLPFFYYYVPKELLTELEQKKDNATALESVLEQILTHFLAVCALNFNFWEIRNNEYHYFSEENGDNGSKRMINIFGWTYGSADYFTNFLTVAHCRHFFNRYMNDIPLKEQRIAILADLVSDSRRIRLVRATMKKVMQERKLTAEDAQELASLFPHFQDPHLKRAQLFFSLVAGIYQNELGIPVKTEFVPMPDYRNTLGLINSGLICLSDDLIDKLNKHQLWSDDEINELRSVYALAAETIEQETGYNQCLIDFCLWNIGRDSGLNHPLYENSMF